MRLVPITKSDVASVLAANPNAVIVVADEVEKGVIRRVRTLAGEKKYGVPRGTIIRADGKVELPDGRTFKDVKSASAASPKSSGKPAAKKTATKKTTAKKPATRKARYVPIYDEESLNYYVDNMPDDEWEDYNQIKGRGPRDAYLDARIDGMSHRSALRKVADQLIKEGNAADKDAVAEKRSARARGDLKKPAAKTAATKPKDEGSPIAVKSATASLNAADAKLRKYVRDVEAGRIEEDPAKRRVLERGVYNAEQNLIGTVDKYGTPAQKKAAEKYRAKGKGTTPGTKRAIPVKTAPAKKTPAKKTTAKRPKGATKNAMDDSVTLDKDGLPGRPIEGSGMRRYTPLTYRNATKKWLTEFTPNMSDNVRAELVKEAERLSQSMNVEDLREGKKELVELATRLRRDNPDDSRDIGSATNHLWYLVQQLVRGQMESRGKAPEAKPAKKTAAPKATKSSLRAMLDEPSKESQMSDDEVNAEYKRLMDKRNSNKRLTKEEMSRLGDMAIERGKRINAKMDAKKTPAKKTAVPERRSQEKKATYRGGKETAASRGRQVDRRYEQSGVSVDQAMTNVREAVTRAGQEFSKNPTREQALKMRSELDLAIYDAKEWIKELEGVKGKAEQLKRAKDLLRDYEGRLSSLERKLDNGYYDDVKKSDDEFTVDVPITKVNDEKMQAFGWAQIAVKPDGRILIDKQEDFIDTLQELEDAAYDFTTSARVAGEFHVRKGNEVGHLIESMVFTPEKIAKLGLPEGSLPLGWWVGFQVNDPVVWERVKKGQYKMFSVHGKGVRETVNDGGRLSNA